jgi:hypothetical protein
MTGPGARRSTLSFLLKNSPMDTAKVFDWFVQDRASSCAFCPFGSLLPQHHRIDRRRGEWPPVLVHDATRRKLR